MVFQQSDDADEIHHFLQDVSANVSRESTGHSPCGFQGYRSLWHVDFQICLNVIFVNGIYLSLTFPKKNKK